MTFLGSTGCATILKGKTREIAISASPTDTEIFVNDASVGRGATVLNLDGSKGVRIDCRRAGFVSFSQVLTSRIAPVWVVLDVVTGLIPLIVDAATGAWNELHPDVVNCALTPVAGPIPVLPPPEGALAPTPP